MPGFGDIKPSVTKNRKTWLVLDSVRTMPVEPSHLQDLVMEDIHTARPFMSGSIHYVPKVGWRLRAYQYDVSRVHESTAAQSAILKTPQVLIAADHEEHDSFRKGNQSGVTYNASVPDAASPFWQHRVPALQSFNVALSGDEKGYPRPDAANDNVPMDRVFISNENHSPDELVLLRFWMPGASRDAGQRVITLYFCGPAGVDDELVGSGRYSLVLSADGLAELYEIPATDGSLAWVKRDEFRWSHPNLVVGSTRAILIVSDARQSPKGKFTGTRILFRTQGQNQLTRSVGVIDNLISRAVNAILTEPFDHIYEVPRDLDQPTTLAPIRLDVRRDVRLEFQVSKSSYPASGFLDSNPIPFDFFPSTAENIVVQIWGVIPTGTSLEIELWKAQDDTAPSKLTEVSSQSGTNWREKTCAPLQRSADHECGPAVQNYFVKILFTGTTDATPTLRRVRVFRDAVLEAAALTEVEFGPAAAGKMPVFALTRTKIQGQTVDPTIDSATVEFDDVGNVLPQLRVRAGMPARIETEIDGAGGRSVLFSGYVAAAPSKLKGTKRGKQYPSDLRQKVVLRINGEWQRVRENYAPHMFNFSQENSDGENVPMRVTDVIRLLLTDGAAYPLSELDVTDRPLRLFSDGDMKQFILMYGADIMAFIVDLAATYFGGRIIFDPNAGTDGMWRLLFQKRAPYNNLCKFFRDHPGDGKLAHAEGAHGSTETTSPGGNAQTIVHTFINRGTLRTRIVPPEFNTLKVTGSRSRDGEPSKEAPNPDELVTTVVYNQKSYNFLGLDPSDPEYPTGANADYLGRAVEAVIADVGIVGGAAVDWIARRAFEFAGHAKKVLTFQAPLTLHTDADDAKQTRPRPLRHYDPVLAQEEDGTFSQYIVSSVTIDYSRDHAQLATYEVVTSEFINTLALTADSPKDRLRSATKGVVGRADSWLDRVLRFTVLQQIGQAAPGAFATSRTSVRCPIQDLDPSSPTFGKFNFQIGYDAPG